MANIITSFRVICSIAILFCKPFGAAFYFFYAVAGLSDMTDGFVARKTGSESEQGARLDTIADFLFVVACFIKLIPILDIEEWIYLWIIVIAAIKIINTVSGFVVYKKLIAVHSVLNKITGAMIFTIPILLYWIELRCLALIACAVATFAAIQEGHLIRTRRLDI